MNESCDSSVDRQGCSKDCRPFPVGIGVLDRYIDNNKKAESPHIATAMQHNAYYFPLLDLSQSQSGDAFTSVNVILVSALQDRSLMQYEDLTSLLMSTTNMARRISVFMPCFRASLSSVSSSSFVDPSFSLVCSSSIVVVWRSVRGWPLQPTPATHHFPLLSAERKSASVSRRGSVC
jgi:hypothetical protein